MTALSRVVVLSLVLVCVAGNAAAQTITVEAWIDGRSQLIISGNTAQWYHLDYSAPGRGGVTYPTVINGVDWYPVWPGDPGDPDNYFCSCYSDVFAGVNPPLPSSAIPVGLNIIQARDTVSIIQQPDPGNGYELIVEFDDNALGGADWYEIELQIAGAEGIPATSGRGAAILVLLMIGAAILVLRTQRGAL